VALRLARGNPTLSPVEDPRERAMAKYGKKAGAKVESTMREMKQGKLRSGSGKKVTDPKQAIAIGLSEARKRGAKVPKKKKKSAAKKRRSRST
jgi:hypothetical protein